MSFEGALGRAISGDGFGRERCVLSYRDRTHISKGALDSNSNAIYLGVGKSHRGAYSPAGARYVAATGVTYDMLVSLHEAGTGSVFVIRTFGFDSGTRLLLNDYVESMRKAKPNLEARIIGLQNGQNYEQVERMLGFLKEKGITLVEADLFGSDTRNIAMDMKLGTSHNVLMNDRLYRPGELANTQTMEQFERGLRQ